VAPGDSHGRSVMGSLGSGCGCQGSPRSGSRVSGGWVAGTGRVRRRRVLVGVFDAVGWRSAGHRGRGPVASRPHGPPGGGPGTATPGWPGRWGRRAASGPDDGPHTRPGVGRSRGTHSHRRGWPGRCVGRVGRRGWCGPPPAAGSGPTKDRGQQRRRPEPHLESVHPVLVLVTQLLQLAPVSGQWLFLGVGVVLVGPVAGDQHPGDRPIAGQPSAGLGVQGS
jgi:hypothetical protein